MSQRNYILNIKPLHTGHSRLTTETHWRTSAKCFILQIIF